MVTHAEEKYSYDVDGKYTAYKSSWADKREVEKAIVHEEQQQINLRAQKCGNLTLGCKIKNR